MITIPHTGYTSRRAAEVLGCGVREACRQLRAMGYENRDGRWFPVDAPRRSQDAWNAKVDRSTHQ